MKNRTLFLALSLFGLVASAPLLSGCRFFGSKAAQAYSQYQAASAEGDLTAARAALVTLVHAQEDVPDYWIELGKVDLQLADYPQAFDAFSHAHELDQSNVQVLSYMTELALLSGQIPLADEQAKSLALLDPNNQAVTLVQGYVALRAGDLDKADAAADKLLGQAPNDTSSTILKARILITRHDIDSAIALLEKQHAAVPEDRGALRALTSLYESRDDWPDTMRVQLALHKLDPKDAKSSETLVESALRSGRIDIARAASLPLLSATAPAEQVQTTLTAWARYAPKGTVLPGAEQMAKAATADHRLSFADYFNRVGNPSAAAALLGSPQLPVAPGNARRNALLAQSLALSGRAGEAKALFDLVLTGEPDQVDALRGRSAFLARTGATRQAIIDAQRLISVSPRTGDDRLLLAQAYLGAGSRNDVRRTLWQAFQDMPDDERVYQALKSVLASTGDREGVDRVADEFTDARMSKLKKELV